jgi:hypothetical protein
MPSVYELAVQTSQTLTASPSLEIMAGASPILLEEFEIANTAATAASLIFGRPGNTPTTGTQQGATLPIDRRGAASAGKLIVAGWGTAPTVPAAGDTHRRIGLPANVGAGSLNIWTLDVPMVIDAARSGSLILWNASAIGVLNVRARWREIT